MKGTDLALALGISPQAVSKLRRRGMPTISVEAAQKWRRRHLEAARVKDQRMGVIAAPPAAAEAEDEPPLDGDTEDYRRHRADRERIRAEREQLELDKLRGRLGDIEELARINFTAWRALRDQVQAVPARIKDQLAAAVDAAVIEALLAAELDAVLAAFDPTKYVEADDEDE